MLGIGRQSCANWLSTPETEYEGEAWIPGYWTAVNIVNTKTHVVGSNSDVPAIFGEIKKICSAEPSTTLADAIARVYFQFQQSGK